MSFSSSGATIWGGLMNFSLILRVFRAENEKRFDWALHKQVGEEERQLHEPSAQEFN